MHTTLVIAIVTVVISLAFDLMKGRKWYAVYEDCSNIAGIGSACTYTRGIESVYSFIYEGRTFYKGRLIMLFILGLYAIGIL